MGMLSDRFRNTINEFRKKDLATMDDLLYALNQDVRNRDSLVVNAKDKDEMLKIMEETY
jgi:hypothetical protein